MNGLLSVKVTCDDSIKGMAKPVIQKINSFLVGLGFERVGK